MRMQRKHKKREYKKKKQWQEEGNKIWIDQDRKQKRLGQLKLK